MKKELMSGFGIIGFVIFTLSLACLYSCGPRDQGSAPLSKDGVNKDLSTNPGHGAASPSSRPSTSAAPPTLLERMNALLIRSSGCGPSGHPIGCTGANQRVWFTDADPINWNFQDLFRNRVTGLASDTFNPATLNPSDQSGSHATAMAAQLREVAPRAGMIQGGLHGLFDGSRPSYTADRASFPIETSSIDGTNLRMSADFEMPFSGCGSGSGQLVDPADPHHSHPMAAADRIYVIIAGNDGNATDSNLGWCIPDGYVPRLGNVIVTVAVKADGTLSTPSARCGKVHQFCLAVPLDGPTSPTAPTVAGSLALLMEAIPGRPLRDYVTAVLNSATPLPGSPRLTGRGLLNVDAALEYLRTH